MDKKSFFLVVLSLCCISMGVYAQDTTKRKTIDITSSFKPVLRDAVKINFNAAPPVLDTSRPRLSYTIPAQYLFLNYQPGEMKPVALQRDSMNPWTNYNYIKIGAGNIHIPYVRTGFSFGDGKTTFINLFANELNSKGSLPYQKNGRTDVNLTGTFKTPNNLEWNGGVGFKNDIYYLYGFQPDTLKFSADQLKQTFSTVNANISLRNTVATEFGLLYHPNFKTSYFTDNHNPKGNEVNTVLNLPLEKLIGKEFAFDLGVTADLTHYNLPSANSAQNNNIYYVNPAFLVKTQNLYLHAGVTPSWDNKIFHLLPNFLADISTSDQKFTVQAGWIGYYDKGSYQRFESINPWLEQPDSLENTRMQEIYGGFKGSVGSHFAYAAKVGILTYKNMPLFQNDYRNADAGKDFVIQYATSMQAAQFHGEVSYLQGDVLEVTGSINGLQFHDLKGTAQPWGLVPVEFNAHFKWQAFKDFWAKADLYTFQGAEYLATNGSSQRGDRGTDLNAGVEFRITHQLNLWFQMNNIFNNKYQRWNQYQVYGFNVLGGIVFSFGGK